MESIFEESSFLFSLIIARILETSVLPLKIYFILFSIV